MTLIEAIQSHIDINVKSSAISPFSYLLEVKDLKIHYVRIERFQLDSFKTSAQILKSNYGKVITIFEDIYKSQPQKVIERIKYQLNFSERIHGRKTTIQKINKLEAVKFLEENHLNKALKTKYSFGLFFNEALVAVACFGQVINMRNGSKSSELIRFCSKSGTRVVGGMDKLIKHFKTEKNLDELMSYCDLDWSDGNSYIKLGFKDVSRINPTKFVIHIPSFERIPESLFLKKFDPLKVNFDEYRTVENSGSIKYIKYF